MMRRKLKAISLNTPPQKRKSKKKPKIHTGGVWCSSMGKNMALAHMGLNLDSTEPLISRNDIIKWKSTEDEDHHKFSRSIMQPCNISQSLMNKENNSNNDDDDDSEEESMEKEYAVARAVHSRAKKLPKGLGHFASLHVLLNQERVSRGIMPLHRSIELDELASNHARYMSEHQDLVHSNASDLMAKVVKVGPCRRLGENVQRGKSTKHIHKKMMKSSIMADKNNVLDRRYVSFGVGIGTSDNDGVYVCQIFRG